MIGGEDPRSDVELLHAHVAGDRRAFTILIDRHRGLLWSAALRTTGDPDDAADALQDALLKAHRMAPNFRSEAKVSSWLHRITVNASLDRLRRNKVRETVPLFEYTEAAPAERHDPNAIIDLSVSIGRALYQLPAEQRAVIVAVDMEGLSMPEAADLLGIPVGTAKSRCSRARARLAVILGHLNDDP